jgi:hypothetical protein
MENMAVDKSTVSRWARRLASSEQGRGNVSDLPHSSRPSTAVTPATMQRTDSHIPNDRRITTRELDAIFVIGKGSVYKIIHQLGYSKVCARWVPRSLTEEHKKQRKIICSELLAHYEAEGDDFLSTIVTVMRHGFVTSSPRRGIHFRNKEMVATETCKVVPRRLYRLSHLGGVRP